VPPTGWPSPLAQENLKSQWSTFCVHPAARSPEVLRWLSSFHRAFQADVGWVESDYVMLVVHCVLEIMDILSLSFGSCNQSEIAGLIEDV